MFPPFLRKVWSVTKHIMSTLTRKIFDFIRNLCKKQKTSTTSFRLWSQLIRGFTTCSFIIAVLLIMVGLIPVFRASPDNIHEPLQLWFSITFVSIFIYFILKGLELSILHSEKEEDRLNAQHLRDLQWQSIKKSQEIDAIERGIRITEQCTNLLNSPKLNNCSAEEARRLLFEIFLDEVAVDNFIKHSNLSLFSNKRLGQARDEGVVLSVGDSVITVQDIRKIDVAVGFRFGLLLSALKDWSQNYTTGVRTLDQTTQGIARSDLLNTLESKFKKKSNISGRFRDAFSLVFIGRMR